MEVRILSWRDASMHARKDVHITMDSLSEREDASKGKKNPVPVVLCPTPTVSTFQATVHYVNAKQ